MSRAGALSSKNAMRDGECVELLQWLLPELHLRWAGFRLPRKQVCKRIARRMQELDLESASEYRRYLMFHESERAVADSLCRVTISSFYRSKGVFRFLEREVLPVLGADALEAGRRALSAWSAGCGSGEEPYTPSLLWAFRLRSRLPNLDLEILGTDMDETLLRRAQEASYPRGCLKNIPPEWLTAFQVTGTQYRLRPGYRDNARFERHDIRGAPIGGPYDLVLCRNLAFTYFDDDLQRATAERLRRSLRDGGALVLGSHETLPSVTGYAAWSEKLKVYQRTAD